MKLKNSLLIFILIVIQFKISFGQEGFGAGGGTLYNTKNGYLGLSARVLIPVTKKLYAVPYGYYYFHEGKFLGGVSALVPFYEYRFLNFYAIASGTIKGSASVKASGSVAANNNGASGNQNASASGGIKADGEAGFGAFIGNNCLKGYVEPRYAVRQEAFLLHTGLVYFFGCKGGGSSKGGFKGKKRKGFKSNNRGKTECPAYN
ncbi:MAG: hypothetical protein V4667_04895 [Bacteroidota bacterium]